MAPVQVFHLFRPDKIYLNQAEDQVDLDFVFFYLLSQHYHVVHFPVEFIL